MAVTVTDTGVPATVVDGPDTTKCVAVDGATTTLPEVPVTEPVTVSVAVTVCEPAVFRVTEKLPVPSVRVASAGSPAWGSVEVKWTVPV